VTSVDPQQVRDRMLKLEHIDEDGERSIGDIAAELVGVELDENFAQTFTGEVLRTQVLCRTHYSPKVAVLPSEMVMAAAIVQGMTLAVAILQETGQLPLPP
jgi:hypothetical protein